ncbi:MAG: DUF4255 domain-containing protein [bacterium]|nr:DUF4255 domain-containing protein [bacterium]
MSNALAIAAVSAVLKDRLNDGLINSDLQTLGSVTVTCLPPDRFGPGGVDETPANRLNLYLYRVSPNTGWANQRLPARTSAGTRTANPYLALDLHFLLSAYGTDELNDQILLGYGMQILHETPVLGRDAVRTSLGGANAPDGAILPAAFQQLGAADLADQFEQIRITPYYPDLEATSHLWSSLNTGLRPTALYLATVALIESKTSTRSALPVTERRLYVPTLRRPRIERLLSAPDNVTPPSEGAAIIHGHRLVLLGSSLRGDVTNVRIGDTTVEEADLELDGRRLAFTVPSGLLTGIHGAQVVHEIAKQDSSETIPGERSNLKAFVLSPSFAPGDVTLLSAALVDDEQPAGLVDATVSVTFAHDVGHRQRVHLSLNELNPPGGEPARAYGFDAQPMTGGVEMATQLDFPVRGVAQATYLVRVRIDGAESQLEMTGGAFSGPTLEVTV